MSSILAIDYGKKRIGLALADENIKIPVLIKPIEYQVSKIEKLYEEIKKICDNNEVTKIVIGLPLSFNFKQTPICEEIKKFGEELKKNLNKKVIYYNEVLSTELARKIQENNQKKLKTIYKTSPKLDSQSAAIILENYLKSL